MRNTDYRLVDFQFGVKWLKSELSKYQGLGLSGDELLENVIGRLKQEKSNDALQDELFDLLGFDRFPLIQTLLQHRGDIVYSLSLPTRQDLPRPEPKRPTIASQVTVQMDYEKQIQKLARKEEKRLLRAWAKNANDSSDDEQPVVQAVSSQPQINFNKFNKKKTGADVPVYPHVYDLQREV